MKSLLSIRILATLLVVLTIGLPLAIPDARTSLFEGISLLLAGDLEALHQWARELGFWAPLATSGLMLAQALAAPIPAVLVTWTNALLFGWFWGGCLSILSATLAASVCYFIGQAAGEPLLNALVSEKHREQWQDKAQRFGVQTILVARLLPFVPFDPISYLAGAGKLRFSHFFWATLVGQIPAGFAYSYLGAQISQPARFITTGIGIFVALIIIGLVARRWKLSSRKMVPAK